MICPFCNEKTFPKKKNIMEGWSVAKTVLICPLCGKELPETPAEKESPAPDKNADRRNALSALLGYDRYSETVNSAYDKYGEIHDVWTPDNCLLQIKLHLLLQLLGNRIVRIPGHSTQ